VSRPPRLGRPSYVERPAFGRARVSFGSGSRLTLAPACLPRFDRCGYGLTTIPAFPSVLGSAPRSAAAAAVFLPNSGNSTYGGRGHTAQLGHRRTLSPELLRTTWSEWGRRGATAPLALAGPTAILDATPSPADTGRAMSQENVQLVRRALETVNRGGLEGIIKFIDEAAAPDAELTTPGLPDAGPVRGREASKDWWRTLLRELDLRIEAEEYIDAGDAVVVVARWIARGRASGAEVTDRWFSVWGIRRLQVTHVTAYRTKVAALEAAGLRE
jgi:ketosteroid isomerase-like protein